MAREEVERRRRPSYGIIMIGGGAIDCDAVLRSHQQNGKTVAFRQFKGRSPPPSIRLRAFLAAGAAIIGALASGFG